MSALLAAALDYAQRLGWPVHPLRAGTKRPCTEHGFHDATCDPEQIRRWWSSTPAANIGSPLTDDFVVLDEDVPGALEVVTANLGPLPSTAVSRTRRGGRHVFYRTDGRRLHNGHKLVEGDEPDKPAVALYCGGLHYFVLPPSRVEPGAYEWIVEPDSPDAIAPAPEWLYGVASERRGRDPAEWEALAGKTILESEGLGQWGGRNETLTALCGLLYRRLPAPLAYDLAYLWSQHRCSPPMDEREVQRTLCSVARRELARRTGRPS